MKKFQVGLLVLGIMGSLWFTKTTNAAEYQPEIHDSNTAEVTAVSDLENSDLIVVMEDGAVVHGEVEITNMSNPSDKILINSDVDPMAISVAEYKKDPDNVETKEFPNQLKISRAATPPAYSVGLAPNAFYNSASFSGQGWRFAERYYYPTGNNGPYLRWRTYNDSGVVGESLAANNTYKYGTAYGQIIYTGSYSYVYGMTTYYTYNPIPGTWFNVANI